jgi:beta-lactam-binding protein with PASTA domain
MMRDERELKWFGESSPSISIAVDPRPNMTTVPDVYESDRDSATSDIQAAGLVAEFAGDLTANPSYVVRQRPEAGKVERLGSTVTCTLKKGRPNLVPQR